MIATKDLIAALAAQPQPVRRIGPPLRRSALWLVLAGVLLAVLAISHNFRPDFGLHLQDGHFQLRLATTAATGILAAVAAFMVSVPGRSRLWMALPLPAFATWVATIGHQCLTDWVALGPQGMTLGETADCFATLVMIGLPLSLTAGLMLRHARHFNLSGVVFLATLSVSAITALAMTLFHALDASVLILAFNLVTGAVFIAAGAVFSRVVAARPTAMSA